MLVLGEQIEDQRIEQREGDEPQKVGRGYIMEDLVSQVRAMGLHILITIGQHCRVLGGRLFEKISL